MESSKSENKVITVIDSICGSGKTTYIFDYIKSYTHHENGDPRRIPEKWFIYVTPYLDEIKRLKENNNSFREPSTDNNKNENENYSKTQDLIKILNSQFANIVMSHSLFLICLDTITEFIGKSYLNFELIIDESPDIYELYDLKPGDIKKLKSDFEFDSIDDDNDKYGVFKRDLKETVLHCKLKSEAKHILKQGSRYDDVYNACEGGNLYLLDKSYFISVLPLELIKVFSEVKFLTYMFKEQFNELYLKAFGFEINYQYTEKIEGTEHKYQAVDGFKPYSGEHLRDLITVLNPKEHDLSYKWIEFGIDYNALSSNWHDKVIAFKKKADIDKLLEGINGFYRKSKAKQGNFMWTTFKKHKELYEVLPFGKKDSCFCSCTARATNKYAGKTNLAYMINLFPNSNINKFIEKLSVDISLKRNIFSLSSLIQWVFRSAIRKNEPINIYIPSSRMRKLFLDWLNGEFEA